MKNKFFTSIIALALSSFLGTILYATGNENKNRNVIYELSDTELNATRAECTQIGIEHGLHGDELNTFIYECFVDTIVVNYESSDSFELTAEEPDMPATEEETPS